ncbi:MAG: aspartate--tRNA ligase [Actinomycetota bacterium]|nr:aspartate--tRNA ligase [Actinomycetota bacterium]
MDLRTGLRTHACGELRPDHAGAEVVLCGWVAHRRDHGGVIFLDLRDRPGIVQVVFHPEDAPDAYAAADATRGEWVVRVAGEVRLRPEGTANPNLGTGEVEVMARSLEVLSESEPPPFPIEDRVEADESTRLRHRYLDLRRPEMTGVLELRHRVIRFIRRYFDERGFVDVETPDLTRSTPEGARDFLVPARGIPGSFYALPQSPQLFKQLLMVAGLDRYYQIVRCFRDEATRADRQPEFTQLDVEMSFVEEEDVLGLIEPMLAGLLRETHGVDVPTPFQRLTYADAIDRYGSDKPDLRYGMELVDLTGAFRRTEFRVFANVVASGGQIKGFAAPGAASWSRRELDELVQEARSRGASGLVWLAFLRSEIKSPVSSYLSPDELGDIARLTQASDGDLVLIVADAPDRVAVALDGLRRHMAARLGLVPGNEWKFLWIVEPPLFEWSGEEEKWVSVHHPFTSPATDDADPATARARAYDVVLNGFELGGGSIRIHRPAVQRKVFEVLGLSPEEAEEKFGFLLQAFRYGVPPHGGIAFGLDRLVMLLAGKENIREVIAFPKTASGQDLLTGAPGTVSAEQLRELGLRLVEPPPGGAR